MGQRQAPAVLLLSAAQQMLLEQGEAAPKVFHRHIIQKRCCVHSTSRMQVLRLKPV